MGDYRIHVLMLNEHFSQEHADVHFEGKESENNKLLDWEDELLLRGEINFSEEKKKGVYALKGYKNETMFEIPLNNMRVFQFQDPAGELMEIACSESIYEKHELNTDEKLLELTLKGEPYANPIPGVYIASNEFPKELIVGDRD